MSNFFRELFPTRNLLDARRDWVSFEIEPEDKGPGCSPADQVRLANRLHALRQDLIGKPPEEDHWPIPEVTDDQRFMRPAVQITFW